MTNESPKFNSVGQGVAASELLPVVYSELRGLAAALLERRPGHTLQPTALVHEAYVKLAGVDSLWRGREHFMATASLAMRQVLVDHARRKAADKRGGKSSSRVSLSGLAADSKVECDIRIAELDELLTELSRSDARAARIAEMRLFGGMEQDEMAGVLGVSRATVSSDWRFARAWIAGRMREQKSE